MGVPSYTENETGLSVSHPLSARTRREEPEPV